MITRRSSGGARRFLPIGPRRPRRIDRDGACAFVLSGGASLGAAQAGMLRALYERGIVPDLLVGSSAGALNAAFVASRAQHVATADELAEVWRALRRSDVFPLRPLAALRGLAGRRDHLLDDSRLRSLVERHLEFERLEDSPIPLHLVAVDARDGREIRLSRGRTLDTVLASSAIPAVFPPVLIGDMRLIDGGVANHTPISHAVELGATTVYVLPTGDVRRRAGAARGALAAVLEATSLMAQRRLAADIATYAREVDLVVMPAPRTAVQPIDFSRARELIEESLDAARAALDAQAAEASVAA
jgi:NTE family protein